MLQSAHSLTMCLARHCYLDDSQHHSLESYTGRILMIKKDEHLFLGEADSGSDGIIKRIGLPTFIVLLTFSLLPLQSILLTLHFPPSTQKWMTLKSLSLATFSSLVIL